MCERKINVCIRYLRCECQQQSESKQVIGRIGKRAWMKLHILKYEEEEKKNRIFYIRKKSAL